MNSDSSQYLDDQYPDTLGGDVLSIALIGPDEDRRKAAADALAGCQGGGVREFSTYPPSLDDVPRLLEQNYDVIIIDLDSHPEYALELVESICAKGAATVMIYSAKADSELLVRCMRAGAREFLTLPFAQNTMAEALVRASARRPASRTPKKAGGRLLVFLGAKGGDGVTTLACNFAVALAQDSGQNTLLIDLDLPLGDAALNLGVVAEYSAINALQNAARLDASFLARLLVKHSSGVSVLAAPGKFPQFDASNDAIDRLITVARQEFDNVVIDMGSRLDLMGTSLFKEGSTVYLVIQAGIAGLRNSNRLISQFFSGMVPKLEIVLNRFEARTMGVSEDQITKALTRPAQWKIPNDYNAVRRMQTTAIPLALEDSAISRLIHQMARTACGLPANPEKKSGFSLKSLSRSLSSKMTTSDEEPAITQLGLAVGHEDSHASQAAPRSDASGNGAGRSARAAAASAKPAAEEKAEPRSRQTENTAAKPAATASAGAAGKPAGPETRHYKGSTYVKGPDGEWHLQQDEPAAVEPEKQKETPAVAWSTPAPIAFGAGLGPSELNALASVPGRFEYTPSIGEVLPIGTHTLSVVFTPSDGARYGQTRATVTLSVVRATPLIQWSAPASMSCGTPLGSTELNATAAVPGRFEYNPAAGEVLEVGEHTLTATFFPDDERGYTQAQATVPITVTRELPLIAWPAPAAISYGTALGEAELNAAASVEGRFEYSPRPGDVLSAGTHTLAVTFYPDNNTAYSSAQSSVPITVNKATPIVNWPAPAPISYGAALGAAQLNAVGSVEGRLDYTPTAGEVLTAGTHKLSVVFTPADAVNYTSVQSKTSITVTKATPVIHWQDPASITYGTALGAAQLNAAASVPGRFVYIPAGGAVLAAGTHKPSVIFTPADTANFNPAQSSVSLVVTRATPVVTWPELAPIPYGTALSEAQLNATASVPGRFEYTPGAGEMLAAGTHTLSVTFTPSDTSSYNTVQASESLTVTKAKPTMITWPAPAPIAHGAALGDAELNASAPVPGSFVYTPAAGEVLATGTHALTVTFTPEDSNLPATQATVSLTVTKAMPTLAWSAPAAMNYGSALGDAQLNATASVPGRFDYTPGMGEVLTAGTHTLSVSFTPEDEEGFAVARATVPMTINKATPVLNWSKPAAISYGTPLNSSILNATALVPGAFFYTPAAGTVLTAGTHTLGVTFVPADKADYTPAEATVTIEVEGLPDDFASLFPSMPEAGPTSAAVPQETQAAPQKRNASDASSTQEIRVYKGSTYVKGADGQWYLQKK